MNTELTIKQLINNFNDIITKQCKQTTTKPNELKHIAYNILESKFNYIRTNFIDGREFEIRLKGEFLNSIVYKLPYSLRIVFKITTKRYSNIINNKKQTYYQFSENPISLSYVCVSIDYPGFEFNKDKTKIHIDGWSYDDTILYVKPHDTINNIIQHAYDVCCGQGKMDILIKSQISQPLVKRMMFDKDYEKTLQSYGFIKNKQYDYNAIYDYVVANKLLDIPNNS